MTIASSNFTVLGFGAYTGVGLATKPASLKELQMTGESLGYQTQSISSSNINSSRQISDTTQTGFDVSGGIQIEMAPKVYDDFLSAALWADWQAGFAFVDEDLVIEGSNADDTVNRTITTVTTDVFSTTPAAGRICPGQFFRLEQGAATPISADLVGIYQVESVTNTKEAIVKFVDGDTPFVDAAGAGVDTTAGSTDTARISGSMLRAPEDGSATNMIPKIFLLEKRQGDLTTPLYTYYSSCKVNTFSLSAQSAALLTGSIDFMGSDSKMETGSFSGNNIYIGAADFNGFNAVDHVKEVIVQGKNINGNSSDKLSIQGFDFQISNNLRGVKAIGTKGNVDVLAGQLGVTGNMNVFFANSAMYDLFTAQTEFSLSFRIEVDGDSYVFSFPRVTISSDSMSAGGSDQDLIENMQWTAMFDPTLKTSMQIDRLYAA